MAGVWVDDGKDLFLESTLNKDATNRVTLNIGLFQNYIGLDETSVLADITPITLGSYAPIALVDGSWAVEVVGDTVIATYAAQIFEAIAVDFEDVTGYYLYSTATTTPANDKLVYFNVKGVFQPVAAGESYAISSSVTMGSGIGIIPTEGLFNMAHLFFNNVDLDADRGANLAADLYTNTVGMDAAQDFYSVDNPAGGSYTALTITDGDWTVTGGQATLAAALDFTATGTDFTPDTVGYVFSSNGATRRLYGIDQNADTPTNIQAGDTYSVTPVNTASSGGIPTPFPVVTGELYTPVNFSVDSIVGNSAICSWDAPIQGTAIGYKVKDDAGKVWQIIPWPSSGDAVTGLTWSTTHTLHIVTYDSAGESAASTTDTAVIGVRTARVFYEQDFETSWPNNTPDPVLQINTDVILTGAGYVSDDLYTLTTEQAHSGTQCLRLNCEGRNGYANTAIQNTGLTVFKVHDTSGAHNGVLYFLDDTGYNIDTVFAVGDRIYNRSNGYSLWEIDSFATVNATNDKAILTKLSDPIDGTAAVFNSGDLISITVAPSNLVTSTPPVITDTRRNDTNAFEALMYNPDTAGEPYLAAGESYFKRYYFRFNLTVPPWTGMKMGYFGAGGTTPVMPVLRCPDGTPSSMILVMNTNPYGSNYDAPLGSVANDVWYYMEVEYRSSTVPGANDGILNVWLAESGSEPIDSSTPDLTTTDNELVVLSNSAKFALWGNTQHWNDITGSIYIDDVIISNEWNGAA